MVLDASIVIESVKRSLDTVERKRKAEIDNAFTACLDDLSLRLKSDASLEKVDVSLSTSDREKTLTGSNSNFDRLFALMVSMGNTKRVLKWVDQKQFLRDFESLTPTAGIPSFFSQLTSVDGKPTIRFDVPCSGSGTLSVYFFSSPSSAVTVNFNYLSPLLQGTLAYFFGIASSKGFHYYSNYKELVALAASNDNFVHNAESKFKMDKFTSDVKGIQNTISRRRN